MRVKLWFSGHTGSLQRPWEPSENFPLQHSPISHQAEPALQVGTKLFFVIYTRNIFRIFVINQADKLTFNRAMLLNVGYTEAMKLSEWDCLGGFMFTSCVLIAPLWHLRALFYPQCSMMLTCCPRMTGTSTTALDRDGFSNNINFDWKTW